MKHLIKSTAVAIVLAASSLTASAAAIPSVIFQAGNFDITGTVLIDVTIAGRTQGIGQIDVLRNDGVTTWQSGDNGNYLNFEYSDYSLSSTVPVGPLTVFTATGGVVNFWLSDSATSYRPDLNYSDAVAAMSAGQTSTYVTGLGVGDTVGTFTSQTYSANGYLDAVSGTYVSLFDTNNVVTLGSILTDLSFNISADNIHGSNIHSDYAYSGSADLNGKIATVSEPMSGLLVGIGMVGLGFASRRKKDATSA